CIERKQSAVGWVEPKAKPTTPMPHTPRTKPAELPTSVESSSNDFAEVNHRLDMVGFAFGSTHPYPTTSNRAYWLTSHLLPAPSKLICKRAFGPCPSKCRMVPSPNFGCSTRIPRR